ncbi:uncharacterized protein CCR75_003565 [Bremia lactucae]|uniref:Peroxisomal membrane protein PEX16 n=1 Tax=Bremia lactucae TaxID=4779 RepID=A0A976IE67_BRELC|nr:hypothetical protein CCR75_003565 [Bremia lactucae]
MARRRWGSARLWEVYSRNYKPAQTGETSTLRPLSNPEAAVGSSKCNHGVSSVGLLPFDTPTAQLYSSRAGNLTTVAGGCPSVAVTRRYWSTFCGHGCWQAVLTLWFKFDVRLDDVIQYAGYCMARTPPPLSRTLFQRLQQAFGNTVAEYIVQWKRIWWILCSVCISTLWIQRNRVVHERQQLSLLGSVQEFFSNGLRQLRALSARERRTLPSRVQGIRLWQCIELLGEIIVLSRASHQVASHVQPPGISTLALLIWLRTFQKSCSH